MSSFTDHETTSKKYSTLNVENSSKQRPPRFKANNSSFKIELTKTKKLLVLSKFRLSPLEGIPKIKDGSRNNMLYPNSDIKLRCHSQSVQRYKPSKLLLLSRPACKKKANISFCSSKLENTEPSTSRPRKVMSPF